MTKHINIDTPTNSEFDFTEEELMTWTYRDTYFVQLLNDEISLDTAREDLASFRGGKYYTGSNRKYMSDNPKKETLND